MIHRFHSLGISCSLISLVLDHISDNLEEETPSFIDVAGSCLVTDLPRVIETPMDRQARVIETPMDRQVRTMTDGVGPSNARDQQMDTDLAVLPPEIQENYMLWTYYILNKEYPRYPRLELKRILSENNEKFTPSYEAIGIEYKAAIDAERAGKNSGLYGI